MKVLSITPRKQAGISLEFATVEIRGRQYRFGRAANGTEWFGKHGTPVPAGVSELLTSAVNGWCGGDGEPFEGFGLNFSVFGHEVTI
jgi:hypothetical protein